MEENLNIENLKQELVLEDRFKNTLNTIKYGRENKFEFFSNFNLDGLTEKEIYEKSLAFNKKYNGLLYENFTLNLNNDDSAISEKLYYAEINEILKNTEDNNENIKYEVISNL